MQKIDPRRLREQAALHRDNASKTEDGLSREIMLLLAKICDDEAAKAEVPPQPREQA